MDAGRIPKLTRTVRGALITPAPGVVSSDDLIAMPETQWRTLRNRISDGREGHPSGLLARCLFPGCGGEVYISERAKGPRRYPYFAHRNGQGLGCPWHPNSRLSADNARAAQYQGNQVSPAHEFICAELARLVRLDERFESCSIDSTYVQGEDGQRGRYPDVRFRWEGFPECVLEVQLSNTFQPEISERGIFYQSKGMPLIWVLHAVEPRLENLPSSFRDVILRHKNNAFALDEGAKEASLRERSLVLRCYLLGEDLSIKESHLVRFDQLSFPRLGLPFFKNMLLPDPALLKERRRPWMVALRTLKKETNGHWYASDLGRPEVEAAFESLPVPIEGKDSRYDFARLVGIVMTLTTDAAVKFEDLVYNRMPNATAALNTFLKRTGPQQACAVAVETLIHRTPLGERLKPTVWKHVREAYSSSPVQYGPGHQFYDALVWMIPEVFDEGMREELALSHALPQWAQGTKTVADL